MGLLNLLTDNVAAVAKSKVDDIISEKLLGINLDTLEHESHLAIIGNIESRFKESSENYLKNQLKPLAYKTKDFVIDKTIGAAKDFLNDLAQPVTDMEQNLWKLTSKFNNSDLSNSQTGLDTPLTQQEKGAFDSTVAVNRLGFKDNSSALDPTNTTNNGVANIDGSFPNLSTLRTKLKANDDKFSLLQPYFFKVDIAFLENPPLDSTTKLDIEIRRFQSIIPLLIQSIEIPGIQTHDIPEAITNEFGYASLAGRTNIADSNSLSIGFLSSQYPIQESLFLQWLKQTTGDKYFYDTIPFRKANITVSAIDSSFRKVLFQYVFRDAFPITIGTYGPDHSMGEFAARTVAFNFNEMRINLGQLT